MILNQVAKINVENIRTITIVDASLTSTSNYDAYFGPLIDDWNTAPLFIVLNKTPDFKNMLIAGFSSYANSVLSITQIYRLTEVGGTWANVTRNDWFINIHVGDTYKIVEI